MSIVSVHGPNMWGGTGAAGGGTGNIIQNAQIKVTADQTNGLRFTVEPVNTGRPAADYDWTFTQVSSPVSQADTKTPFVVTFATTGTKTITLTVAAGAGPPAGGVYTIDVTALTSGPRMVAEDGDEPPEESGLMVGFDPAAHTVDEVKAYADEHPEEIEELLEAEEAGKNRITLVDWLSQQ